MQTPAATAVIAPGASRSRWSLDARLMMRPAATFRRLSTQPLQSGAVVALRRPMMMAIALGCMASVIATGGVTLRLAAPATIYWLYAPLASTLALALVLVTGRRQSQRGAGLVPPPSTVVDIYFAGHAPMLLFTLVGVSMTLLPPYQAWTVLATWGFGFLLVGLAWSIRIDYCFFRDFLGQTPRAAASRVILLRLIVWPLVFGVFSVPGLSFGAFGEELLAVARELVAA